MILNKHVKLIVFLILSIFTMTSIGCASQIHDENIASMSASKNSQPHPSTASSPETPPSDPTSENSFAGLAVLSVLVLSVIASIAVALGANFGSSIPF